MKHAESVVGTEAGSLSRHDLVQHRLARLGREIGAEARSPHYLAHPAVSHHVASRNIADAYTVAKERTNLRLRQRCRNDRHMGTEEQDGTRDSHGTSAKVSSVRVLSTRSSS